MAIPTIDERASLWGMFGGVGFTLGWLRAYRHKFPGLKPHVQAFADLRVRGWDLLKLETDQDQQLCEAHGAIRCIDGDFDPLVIKVGKFIMAEVGGDRRAPLNRLYFGNKTISQVTRPVLGEQLATVTTWLPNLKKEAIPSLAQMAAPIEKCVEAANVAINTREQIKQARHEYRVVGARHKFVQDLNAQRKATYGFLAELPHTDGFEHLPVSFGDFFFEHTTRDDSEPTMEDVKATIERLQLELEDNRAMLQVMVDAQAAEEANKERNAALAVQLAELEKTAADAMKQAAAVRAQLGKK